MPVTKRSDLIYTDILQAAIQGAYAGMVALYGTGAAVINTTMPKVGATGSGAGGQFVGGDTIKIPYFDSIGELDDLADHHRYVGELGHHSSSRRPVITAARWAGGTAPRPSATPRPTGARRDFSPNGRDGRRAEEGSATASAGRQRMSAMPAPDCLEEG